MTAKTVILSAIMTLVSGSVWADDCDSIRSRIDALPASGGTVTIAAGLYNCSAPLVIVKSGVQLLGAGHSLVTIRLADHIHAPLLVIGNPKTVVDQNGNYVAATRVDHVRVSGITFDGNRANHDPSKECGEGSCEGNTTSVRNNGITIRGASQISVSDVVAHSMISGGMVTEKYCDRLNVHDFESYDNYYDGFAGYQTEKSEFYNLNLHDNRGAGISIDIDFNDNTVHDSQLVKNGDVGIFARDLSGNHFNGLSIQGSGNHGVFMAESQGVGTCPRDNQFNSVLINGSKGVGIRLNDACPGNRVSGKSNLTGNSDGPFSESESGSLIIDPGVILR